MGLGKFDDTLRVDTVLLSQLARVELSEIEALRSRALASIESLIGMTNKPLSFEREMNVIPDKATSDKLLFRAYRGTVLVGYALVVIGWPSVGEWVIQHMIIDPDFRLLGIGSSIVRAIEEFADASEVEATSIFAIPLQESGTSFWNNMGYVDETSRHPITIGGLDHELVVYRKKL
jgi:ribosomal protein S18 acetylase RimI-like enzyme